MNTFKKDEKAPSTQHADPKINQEKGDKMNKNNDNNAQSAPKVGSEKHEPKADAAKLGSNVPSIVEKVGNSHNNEPMVKPAPSEKK